MKPSPPASFISQLKPRMKMVVTMTTNDDADDDDDDDDDKQKAQPLRRNRATHTKPK